MSCQTRTRLSLCSLEDRRVPAVFTVTNLSDGAVSKAGDQPGSLRQAIFDANALSGSDTINFLSGLSGTLALTAGSLPISTSIAINGPGSSVITLSGNKASGVFSAAAATLDLIAIAGLTITGSNNSAVVIGSKVTLSDCVLTGNSTGGQGGAARITSTGSLTAVNCTFSNNTASFGGGAILGFGVQTNTITGAIPLTLSGCTISNNTSPIYGAVLILNGEANASVKVVNTTICNNTTDGNGGAFAISAVSGSLEITNSTVAFNTAAPNSGTILIGSSNGYPVVLQSSVVSQNGSAGATQIVTSGMVGAKNSSLGSVVGISAYSDLGGNRPIGENPMLAPLAANGGPTMTNALLPGSPLMDAGINLTGLTCDQRGTGFPRVIGMATDIGAFERQPPPPTVDSVQVNGGEAQRSRVTSLKVNFSEAVNFPGNINSAFQVVRTGSGNPTGTVNYFATQSGRAVTLNFLNGGGVGLDQDGGLLDGVYQLTVLASKVSGASGPLDGDANGTGGDNYVTPTTGPTRIFRLFGDANGDGAVSTNDFVFFRQSFNGVNDIFDFDGDGFVSTSDFAQFRNRFNTSV
jgi:hypothetical protein